MVLVPLVRDPFGETETAYYGLVSAWDHDSTYGHRLRIEVARRTGINKDPSLGANHERAIFNTVLPAAKPKWQRQWCWAGGPPETMAVIMVAGNQAGCP